MKIAALIVVGALALGGCGGPDGGGDDGTASPAADKELTSRPGVDGTGAPATGSAGGPSASDPGAGGSSGAPTASSSSGGTSGGGTSSGGTSSGGTAVPNDAELQHCVDVVNAYRKTKGLAPLARSATIETFSGKAATSDASTGSPHGYFIQTKGGGGVSSAQNEIPGWPMAQYGTLTKIIDAGTQMMWNEGPGGGHYENIVGKHSAVGCGIQVTPAGKVWISQDFK